MLQCCTWSSLGITYLNTIQNDYTRQGNKCHLVGIYSVDECTTVRVIVSYLDILEGDKTIG